MHKSYKSIFKSKSEKSAGDVATIHDGLLMQFILFYLISCIFYILIYFLINVYLPFSFNLIFFILIVCFHLNLTLFVSINLNLLFLF